MASGGYGPVLRRVERLLEGGTATTLEGGQLLRRFAVDRDSAAFEALVIRHGPMVLGTCRRMLADPDDVEDAFQATFLVLARKAGSIRDGDRLGPWLHGVARRVATRSRALSARRHARERPGAEDRAVDRADPAEAVELRSVLDEELARLPEKYRAPLILCYLEGLTHDEAASRLDWPVGTVRSRLAGGRDRLRTRLSRRGLAPSAAVPALAPSPTLPESLMSSTIRIATLAGPAPARVASLAKGVLIAMLWNKLKTIAVVGLVAGLTVGGAGVAAQQGGEAKTPGPAERPKEGEDNLEAIIQEKRDLEIERDITNREIELFRFDTSQRLRVMEDKAQGIRARLDRVTRRWKAATSRAASGDAQAPRKDNPAAPPAGDPSPPAAGESERPPTVMGLMEGVVLVISANHDRATVLFTKTGERRTCRFPGRVSELTPIVGSSNLLAFQMSGTDLRRVAVFDLKAREWSSIDFRLGEPINGAASPILGAGEVTYNVSGNLYVYRASSRRWGVLEGSKGASFSRASFIGGNNLIVPEVSGRDIKQIRVLEIDTGKEFPIDLREPASGRLASIVIRDGVAYQAGRFIYAFSSLSRTWSILELKRATPVLESQMSGRAGPEDGKLIIPDGELIHIYDAKTGEWTHIDTKDEN